MLYEQEKRVAIAATTAAAQLCEQVRRERGSDALEKSDRSPVTVADFGAQAVICRALAEAFPGDPIVAEEDATMLQQPDFKDRLAQVTSYVQAIAPSATPDAVAAWINRGNGEVSQRYWTLDPIDGTKGFIRGDQYAIALALIEQGKVKVGALACPALPVDSTQPNGARGVLFTAVWDQGAMMIPLNGGNSHPIQVNHSHEVAYMRLIESVEVDHGDRSQQEGIAKAIGMSTPSQHMDSQAKYGAVARGEADLYMRIPLSQASERRENIWDHAAGAIVVEEAGGKVTDLYGQPLDFSLGAKLVNNKGIVASNGVIHEKVLATWKEGN